MMNHEELVQLALKAFDKTSVDTYDRNYFELHLRRMFMQYIANELIGKKVPAPVSDATTVRWDSSPTTVTKNQLLHG